MVGWSYQNGGSSWHLSNVYGRLQSNLTKPLSLQCQCIHLVTTGGTYYRGSCCGASEQRGAQPALFFSIGPLGFCRPLADIVNYCTLLDWQPHQMEWLRKSGSNLQHCKGPFTWADLLLVTSGNRHTASRSGLFFSYFHVPMMLRGLYEQSFVRSFV